MLKLENHLLDVSKLTAIDSGDLNGAGEALLRAAVEALNIERVSIWLFDEQGQTLRLRQAIHGQDLVNESSLALTRTRFPKYFQALDSERSIVAHSASSHEATAEFQDDYLAPNNIVSMLDAPIRHHGLMVGIFCCEHTHFSREWQHYEISFVGQLADLYGRALSANERAGYERQLRQQNEALEALVAKRTESLQTALESFEQAQAHLLETEKMAALGKLVSGIAHEVNTPLGIAVTAISHCQELQTNLQRNFEADKLSRRHLTDYLAETDQAFRLLANNLERAAELIQNFKRTAVDQSSFQLNRFLLNDYLHTIQTSLQPMLRQCQAQLTIDCPLELSIHTYQGAVAQIFTNLVSNSCQHGFYPPLESHDIHIECIAMADSVIILYTDNGHGMDAETVKQACEPFFTTARQRGGSGLGLAIVYNLVRQQLQGTFKLNSKPGYGVQVRIELPLQLTSSAT